MLHFKHASLLEFLYQTQLIQHLLCVMHSFNWFNCMLCDFILSFGRNIAVLILKMENLSLNILILSNVPKVISWFLGELNSNEDPPHDINFPCLLFLFWFWSAQYSAKHLDASQLSFICL